MDDAIAVPARRSESISGYMRVAGYLAERDSIRRLDRFGVGIRKKMPAIRKTPAIRWRRRPAPNEIDYILCHARPRLVPSPSVYGIPACGATRGLGCSAEPAVNPSFITNDYGVAARVCPPSLQKAERRAGTRLEFGPSFFHSIRRPLCLSNYLLQDVG
jgi:hypothetical protein